MYIAGFPCQPLSTAGKRTGITDPRLCDCGPMLLYIVERKPKFVVLENVPALLSQPYRGLLECILDGIRKVKTESGKAYYYVEVQEHNAMDFNLPQSRRRIYIIAKARQFGQIKPPQKLGRASLETIYDRDSTPDDLSTYSTTALNHLKEVYKQFAEFGADDKDFVVDIAGGQGLKIKKGQLLTITKTRAEQFAYYFTTFRRRITLAELARAQGFDLANISQGGISDRHCSLKTCSGSSCRLKSHSRGGASLPSSYPPPTAKGGFVGAFPFPSPRLF